MSEYTLLILLHRINKEVFGDNEKPITEIEELLVDIENKPIAKLTRKLRSEIQKTIPVENQGSLSEVVVYIANRTAKLRAMSGR